MSAAIHRKGIQSHKAVRPLLEVNARKSRAALFLMAAGTLILSACTEQGTGPGEVPPVKCDDASVLRMSGVSGTVHKHPKQLQGESVVLDDVKWARGDSVKAFFGGRDVKLVCTRGKDLYLVAYHEGEPTVTRISHDDEGLAGKPGLIISPLISPDGKWVVFNGSTRGKPTFMQELGEGDAAVWRTPLDLRARVMSDPHWHVEDGKTYIYFATLNAVVNYSDRCNQILGSTYRVEKTGDTTLGSFETTGIRGAYRGGISRDGNFAGTSYAATAIYDKSLDSTSLLLPGEQQCNPSMNPYAAGSKHTDYMMVLAFGSVDYPLITGKTFVEGLHENLWIYNKDNRIVWRGKRPNENVYVLFDKPEWSTDPNFATATLMRRSDEKSDIVVMKIGDLANAEEGELNQDQGHLLLAQGGFNRDSFTHLWVAPD
jgi:hypothetical protein